NGRFLCTHPRDSLAAFLRALPFGLAFPTLSDLSDPISSVLSSRPLLFRGFLSGVSDFIRSSEPV
ncbi:hypothetical protein, partial [Streptomyces longwoodensis]|uniref:hypothetical protein n=1 Tax=Streptomyces longwoodensis TaxID=68231 RepID=UPI0038503B2C